MVKIRVPATTANMGPGFDCMGMALKLYNEVEIEENENGVEVVSNGKPFNIPLEENLVYKSMIYILEKYNYKYNGFKIDMLKCDVPVSRGLGSSAACIVAGVTAANTIMGNTLSRQDIVDLCSDIEGHPDNVTPAVVGGMVISTKSQEDVIYSKVSVPQELRFLAMIPEFKVSTEDARKVLPVSYSREDCVYNISRAAALTASMYSGNFDNFREFCKDKLHQPYRKTFINNIDNIFDKAEKSGSLGEFISGSGSTLLCVINKDYNRFFNDMKNYLDNLDGSWQAFLLETDNDGVKVL